MIVIGDVHGCYQTLIALLGKLPKDNICFVGDLIDRGPRSKDVIDLVIQNGYDCVMGNHEMMMLYAIRGDYTVAGLWLQNGGYSTMNSFGMDDKVMTGYADFISSLPVIKKYEDIGLVVSHSSCAEFVNNGEDDTDWDSVLWDRPPFPKKIPGLYNIFGHTPIDTPLIKGNFACIDTCCFSGRKLTAMQFPEKTIFQQDYIDEPQSLTKLSGGGWS